MPIFPERESKDIRETSEEVSPLTIERKEVVTPIPVIFQKQVKSDSGKPLINIPQSGRVKIAIPKPQVELENLSKGPVSDSITWFAAFWIRMIKKAIRFGWELLGGRP
jgi:hypothetical protein